MKCSIDLTASQVNDYSILQFETGLKGDELRAKWQERQRNYHVKPLMEQLGMDKKCGWRAYVATLDAYCCGLLRENEFKNFMRTCDKTAVPSIVQKFMAEMVQVA